MTTLTLPPLSKIPAWLIEQSQDALGAMSAETPIGLRLSCSECPVAHFLQDHFDCPVIVDEEKIQVCLATGWQVIATPRDYGQVIDRLDYLSGQGRREVSIGECRSVIEQVLREEKANA